MHTSVMANARSSDTTVDFVYGKDRPKVDLHPILKLPRSGVKGCRSAQLRRNYAPKNRQ
jgi:hypothetical protein